MSENKKAPYLIAGNDVYFGYYPDDRCDDREPNGYGGEVQCGKTAPYFYYVLDSSRTSFQRSLHRACPYHLFTHPKFTHVGCDAENVLQERIAALESQLAAAQRAKEQTVHHWQNVAEQFKAQLYELFVAFGVSQVHEVFIKKQEMERQLAAHVQTIRQRESDVALAGEIIKGHQQTIREREAEIAHLRVSMKVPYIANLQKVLREREEQLAAANSEVEQLQVQLAGCGVAALGGTKDPSVKGQYGWSPAYQDTLDLRLRCDAAEEQLAKLREAAIALRQYGTCFCDFESSQFSDYPSKEHTYECIAMDAALDKPTAETVPLDMILPCPRCNQLHVDAPEPDKDWTNPPHKSHLCHFCGTVWRPADVPTNGVIKIKTRGTADTWLDKLTAEKE
jgi:hypothetical protein